MGLTAWESLVMVVAVFSHLCAELTFAIGDGCAYRGTLAVTETGKTCQAWASQEPHRHSRTAENYPHSGLTLNYCRNPDNERMLWCYTTDSGTRWEYCKVPTCRNEPAPEELTCATGNGCAYRGTVAVTETGKTCQAWASQEPHKHSRTPENYPHKGLKLNYCRNPDNEGGPWCYTTDSGTRWEYCKVSTCGNEPAPKKLTCATGNGCAYRGTVAVTETGKTCQAWASQKPHRHSRTPENYPYNGLTLNYCRNPDNEMRPWCYTTDSGTRWEYCKVPTCGNEPAPVVPIDADCSAEGLSIAGGNYRLSDGLNQGSVLTYTCPEGYYPFPAMTRRCQQRGRWSPAPSVRQPEECKIVPIDADCSAEGLSIAGGNYTLSDGLNQGSVLTYTCPEGYYPFPAMTRHCQQRGRWSPAPSIRQPEECKIVPIDADCSAEGLSIAGGNYTLSDGLNQGSVLTYTCPEGYYPFPAMTRHCQQRGRWSPAPSIRQPEECKIVPIDADCSAEGLSIAGGNYTLSDGLNQGSVLTYTCPEGYYPFPAMTRHCQQRGRWSPAPSIRQPEECKTVPIDADCSAEGLSIAGGNYTLSDGLNQGSVLTYTCPEGYYPFPAMTRHCQRRGRWSPAPNIIQPEECKMSAIGFDVNEAEEDMLDTMIDESDSVGICGVYRDYDKGTLMTKRWRHPWLAKIEITREDRPSSCQGSLVSRRFILTAAHCFKFEDRPELVKVKIDDGEKGDSAKDIKRFILHPDYNRLAKKNQGIKEFYDYDVALIELKEDVDISVRARPMCIPCTEETNRALMLNDKATCKQHEDELLKKDFEPAQFMGSDELVRKNVTIKLGKNRRNCIKDVKEVVNVDDPTKLVTENFLCTGGIEGVTDHVSCEGDSGGALFVQRQRRLIQVGIVSFGVKDLCKIHGTTIPDSDATSRDFHINLFKVLPFLKWHLADEFQSYQPIEFID